MSINTCNPTKMIVFNKHGNTISRWMKVFQVKENSPQQILILPMMVVKGLQKNGTIQAIAHAFVWCIIYRQGVTNVSIRISRKENIKVLVENWLVKFIKQEMQISHAKLLIKLFKCMYRDFCFVPYLIQIIINIVMLSWKLNIHLELNEAFFQKILQSKIKNDDVKTFFEACCS